MPRPFFYRPPLTLARILLAEDTPLSRQHAGQVLSELYDYYTSIHYTSVVIEVLAVQALLYQAEGTRTSGAAKLSSKRSIWLSLAASYAPSSISARRWRGCWLRSVPNGSIALCSKDSGRIPADVIPGSGPQPGQYGDALAAHPTRTGGAGTAGTSATPTAKLPKTLVISAETVHSHVQHIGEKLAVRGRREIVQAAKDQGLLE